jgi:exosortase C (VPDSG-CTERM-specific)
MRLPSTLEKELTGPLGSGPRSDPLKGRAPRLWGFGAYVALLIGTLAVPLCALVTSAAASDIHSHILLIPFVSAYLIYIGRERLIVSLRTSAVWAIAACCIGAAALAASHLYRGSLSQNDDLALVAAAFVSFVWAGGFLFLGARWMASAAFPMAFLIFMIPLPDGAINWLETASQSASANAASLFFSLTNMPVLREGNFFQIPGITIEVAQECSGIHSSWVLFITSLLAAHMFLRGHLRRAALVAFVIPLGILRNGFRILVIALLCVHIGPRMIDSPIHHRGGPIFFALSLIPFFGLLLWLRRTQQGMPAEAAAGK